MSVLTTRAPGSSTGDDLRFAEAIGELVETDTFVVDRSMRYVQFNTAHARRLNVLWRVRPAKGASILETIPDLTTRAGIFTALERALAGETQRSTQWWGRSENQADPLECVFAPVTDEEGRVIGVAVTAEDVDRAGTPELAYRALEKRYQTLFNAAGDGIAIFRSDGAVMEVNDAFAALVGSTIPEILSTPFWRWIADGDPDRSRRLLGPSFDHDRRFESALCRSDRRMVAVEVLSAPIQIEQGAAAIFQVRDITERARAARELAEKEAQLRLIFENAPIGLGVANLATGALVAANHALLEMYGRDLASASAVPLGRFTHPEDREHEARALGDVAHGARREYTLRKRYVQPDGTEVPAEVRAIRLPDVLGRAPMVLGIVTDLRELAEADRRIRESKEQYRRLTDNAEDLIYRMSGGARGAIEYINPAVERILGFTPAECYADPSLPFKRVHIEDHPRLMEVLTGTADMAKAHVIRWAAADGSWRWLEHRSRLVRDAAGAVIAVEGIARDITARVQADEQLRLLGRVVDQACEAVMITDRAGRIQHVNEAFERVTGYGRDEVIGHDPRLLKSGRQDEAFYRKMWKELAAGRSFSATVKNKKKDGSLYDAEIVVSPVRDPAGVVTHFVGLQRDVTEERIQAEQLRQAQKMEAFGQLTGGVAHDFNNLLTVILATAELIEPSLEPKSDAASFLRDLTESAKHGSTLVRQLLAFGRQGILSPGSMDLESATGEFLGVLRRLLPETITLPPLTGKAPHAFADRRALEQILMNLATNARDAMPDGGTLRLELGTRDVPEGFDEQAPTTAFVTLSVSDTGCGMDAATREKAMEPFFTTKAPGKGTGLGLPMVFGVMKQLGGWVELESTPGHGTTVILGFRRGEAAETALEVPVARAPREVPEHSTILLVEDNAAVRRVATRSLESLGFHVVTAGDGEAGWSTWCTLRSTIDLVLTDAIMPNLSGTDLIRRIREKGGTAPIILASGYTPDNFEDITAEVTLLSKPWTLDSLKSTVSEALAAHAA
jgi:two-component system cell cycle sensor histidine kinase/response regulator CckA